MSRAGVRTGRALAALLAGMVMLAVAGAERAGAEPLPIFNPFYAFRAPTAGVPNQAGKSGNWFGYQQYLGEQGGRLFNSAGADWTVPRVRQHTPGQGEASSDWVGIGGGCMNASCSATDTSLIQAGTEQDVAANGSPAYYAWFETVPQPATPIAAMAIKPGDHMHASVAATGGAGDIWTITVQDLTRGETFTTTVPYVSHRATAEWIEETPMRIGVNPGLAPLPDLTDPAFTAATVNGAPAGLAPAERTYLATLRGVVIGASSVPAPGGTAFAACAWSNRCG